MGETAPVEEGADGGGWIGRGRGKRGGGAHRGRSKGKGCRAKGWEALVVGAGVQRKAIRGRCGRQGTWRGRMLL